MEQHFSVESWKPTMPWERSDEVYDHDQIEALIAKLNTNSLAIRKHPYDPDLWLQRASTLASLRYPELAVGDAHKAILLCQVIMDSLRRKPRFRMGHRWGFCMLDLQSSDDAGQSGERGWQHDRMVVMNRQAHAVRDENLYHWPNFLEGRFVPRVYPWTRDDHRTRSDELVNLLNAEILEAGRLAVGGPACDVKQYAFGKGIGAGDGRELLGVFATRDIPEQGLILSDTSQTWGCNGPGRDGNTDNLSGGLGCQEPLHPNTEEDTTDQDLRWIRDRCGVKAADVILKCRFLLCGISDGAIHPLDHSLIARLTATYREGKWRNFDLENDIVVPYVALQQFGIDIFGNPNYADSYVLFVMMARIDNNAWSDPGSSSVNGLFSLINHSCEPNSKWESQESHLVLNVVASRDIMKGEQIFIEYDQFMSTSSLEVRRSRLRKWLKDPCQCTRCVREEVEASGPSPVSSGPEWDHDDKPILPEDYQRKGHRTDE